METTSWENLIRKLDTRYIQRSLLSRLRQRILQLESFSANQQLRIAEISLPAMILGGTNTQVVTWGRKMPNNVYLTYVGATPALIGAVRPEILSQTDTTCTVKTTATGVVALGSRILLIAWTDGGTTSA